MSELPWPIMRMGDRSPERIEALEKRVKELEAENAAIKEEVERMAKEVDCVRHRTQTESPYLLGIMSGRRDALHEFSAWLASREKEGRK